MTTYPLPTLAAQVTPTGISAPNYNDILLSLQASYQAIYGVDIDIDPDTQDGQWLGIQAKAISDTNQTMIAVYNQFSPATSIGAGLSSVVQINGIERLNPSYSTADITVVGQYGKTIYNGLVGDDQSLGTQWALPASVTFPSGGSITVTATCTQPGAIAAAANTLTNILTPTYGWQSATNAAAAAAGQPVEQDAQLRLRQKTSTQLPALSVSGSLFGNLENLPGVQAVALHENDTNSTDGQSAPAHSVCYSVIGGTLQNIVDTIGFGKGPGCSTWGGGTGATSGTYVDPTTGQAYTINFNIPTAETIVGTITIVPGPNYNTTIGDEMIAAVCAQINSLGIGQSVQYTRLYAPALLVGPYANPATDSDGQTYDLTSVAIAISPSSPTAADVTIAFNQYATTAPSNWTIVT